jgi:hypothetical protein
VSLKLTKRHGTLLLRILVFGAILALAVCIALGWITAASGGVALVVALIAVLALMLTRNDVRQILRRVQKVDAWGVSLDLQAEADEAVRDVQGEESGEEPAEIIDLRLRLENKLVFIGQRLLPAGSSQFATIGSLRTGKHLNKAQARTAARVLSFTNFDLAALAPDERDAFLKDANVLVGNIRAIVFWSVVRQALEAGWGVERIRQGRRLPDYLATKGSFGVRVNPALYLREGSATLGSAIHRVGGADGDVHADQRVVVVPDISPAGTSGDTDPPIIKFRDLLPALDELYKG